MEVNVLLTGDLAQDQKNWELPLFDINYGVGNDIQLKYEVPMAKNQTADGTASGVGESKAGIKAEFYEDEKNKLEIAAYPQVKFITLNSRAQENGLAASGTITTLPLLLSKKIGETRLGDIIFSANLGYNISSKADTEIFFSAATGLGMKLSRHVALMGDLSTEQSISKGADGTRQSLNKIAIGALGSLSKKFLAFVSVGESVYASDQQNHTYAVTGIRLMTDGSRQ